MASDRYASDRPSADNAGWSSPRCREGVGRRIGRRPGDVAGPECVVDRNGHVHDRDRVRRRQRRRDDRPDGCTRSGCRCVRWSVTRRRRRHADATRTESGGHEFPVPDRPTAVRERGAVHVPPGFGVVVAEHIELEFAHGHHGAPVTGDHREDGVAGADPVRDRREFGGVAGLAVGHENGGGALAVGVGGCSVEHDEPSVTRHRRGCAGGIAERRADPLRVRRIEQRSVGIGCGRRHLRHQPRAPDPSRRQPRTRACDAACCRSILCRPRVFLVSMSLRLGQVAVVVSDGR